MNRLALAAVLSACACSPAHGAVDGSDAEAGSGCLFSCGDMDATSDAPLALRVKGIIDGTCASGDGCHLSGMGNMALSAGAEFDAMIGVPSHEMPPMLRVAPGDPLNSYVYLKLRCEGGIQPNCMPGGVPDPALARLFHDWIEAGAPTP